MPRVSGLAIAVYATGARRIRNAELIRVEEESVGVRDVELFLFPHQAGLLPRDGLYQTLSKSRRQVIVFLFRKMYSKRVFTFVSIQVLAMPMLSMAGTRLAH